MTVARDLLAFVMTLTLLGGAAAQSEAELLQPLFKALDKDDDKSVERSEFPGSDEQFKAMDRNRNGKVTFAEYRVSAVARRYIASRNRYAGPPRARADVNTQRMLTIQNIKRFDRNRDGRVTLAEWNGAPEAFANLDLDHNDVVDKRDRKLAEQRVTEQKQGTYDEFEFKTQLLSSELMFRRFDRNKDQLLERKEVASAKFAYLFTLADNNEDDKLDMDEVAEMRRQVASRLASNRPSYEKPRAYIVPFATWDKNNDSRLDTGEWQTGQYLFQRIDINRDGGITKDEVSRYKISVEGEDFVEKFDLNKDGRVTRGEFTGGRDAFRRADRNGDGVVSRADR